MTWKWWSRSYQWKWMCWDMCVVWSVWTAMTALWNSSMFGTWAFLLQLGWYTSKSAVKQKGKEFKQKVPFWMKDVTFVCTETNSKECTTRSGCKCCDSYTYTPNEGDFLCPVKKALICMLQTNTRYWFMLIPTFACAYLRTYLLKCWTVPSPPFPDGDFS